MSIYKYPDEMAAYIQDHVKGKTTKELSEELNQKFSAKYQICFSAAKIKSYKNNHGLKSGTRCGIQKGASSVYPPGMEEFVRSIAPGRTSKEMADLVNAKYGAGTITAEHMKTYKNNHHIASGIDLRFQKGHIPANKGKKMPPEVYEKARRTMFQKGHVPVNKMKIGQYTHTTDGYLIRKVREHGSQWSRFVFVHREVWEKHHGPIPSGKMVSFLDGNKDNCDISNLILIDNDTNLEMNRKKLRFENQDLTRTGAVLAAHSVAIRKRKR